MNLKTQSGRSMVEMLGILAIIGVLSIGSIMGYSYGMDKYRANTIINDIMLRAIDVNAQFDSTGDANLSECLTTTVGQYTIGLENEYCALLTRYPVPEEPFPNGEKGECTPLDYAKHTITINGVDEVWYVSSQSVRNYWDAYHFCEKLGKTMVSLADLYSDTYFNINNYRADVLANALNFDSRVCILVSDKEGYVARLGSYRTGGSFYDTAGYALCYEGTLADLE